MLPLKNVGIFYLHCEQSSLFKSILIINKNCQKLMHSMAMRASIHSQTKFIFSLIKIELKYVQAHKKDNCRGWQMKGSLWINIILKIKDVKIYTTINFLLLFYFCRMILGKTMLLTIKRALQQDWQRGCHPKK